MLVVVLNSATILNLAALHWRSCTMSSKPLLIPEPFSGDCGNWQEWTDHFESVAVVNKWDTDGDKLRVHTVFMKLPENTRKDYGECVKALKRRFFPDSKKELYVAELHTRAKRDNEDWASFGDALRVLSNKAYADLEERARERLALNQFLLQIENPQVAFGVKHKRPQNVEEAVTATIELESYLISSGPITGKSHRVISVTQQQPPRMMSGQRQSRVWPPRRKTTYWASCRQLAGSVPRDGTYE